LYGKIQVTIEDFASLMRPFHNPNSDKVWPARQLPSLKAMAGGIASENSQAPESQAALALYALISLLGL